jgi:hypothetical protein
MTKAQNARKEYFAKKIAESDEWLERAIFAIWQYQTADEKADTVTKHLNGVGFNGADGHGLTVVGWWIAKNTKGGTDKSKFGTSIFSEAKKARCRRQMAKYAGQLVLIAEAKAAKK